MSTTPTITPTQADDQLHRVRDRLRREATLPRCAFPGHLRRRAELLHHAKALLVVTERRIRAQLARP
jgi:hypothetical protein